MTTRLTGTEAGVANGVYHAVWDPLFRITVQQYHDMIENGILGPDDDVELLEGFLVRKMATNPPHRVAKFLTGNALRPILPPGWFLDEHDPVTTDDSEPEPDISALRGEPRDYLKRNPTAADAAKLIEVSDTSLKRDRDKRRIYARAGFPIYWIVNIPERQIEVYTEPSGSTEQPDYAKVTIYKEGDTVPVVIDGREIGRINVKDVLP